MSIISLCPRHLGCVYSIRFKQMLPLLARVPALPCLLTRQLFQDRQQGMFSLLDWISAQVNRSSYYINTSEIPGVAFMCINMMSSHVKITCYYHCYGYIITQKYLDVLLYYQNVISSFSEILGYVRKYLAIFGSFGKCLETFVWP